MNEQALIRFIISEILRVTSNSPLSVHHLWYQKPNPHTLRLRFGPSKRKKDIRFCNDASFQTKEKTTHKPALLTGPRLDQRLVDSLVE